MTKGKLTKLLDTVIKPKHEKRREYIGASSIGSECMRKIWYDFKQYPATKPSNRTVRIWEIGKRLENMLLNFLEQADVKIIRPCSQNHYLEFFDGEFEFFRGHCDALICLKNSDKFIILEMKTAKDSSFKQFVKQGLMKWDLTYYAQVQSYMGMSGIDNAIILVLNKDNSEVFDEQITFDPDYYQLLKEKAQMIHNAKVAPPRIHGSELWWQCRTCKFKEICHK